MAAGGSASFCFLIVCFLVCSSEAQTNITAEKIPAKLGQEVVLPCKAPNNINIDNIRAVEWRRPELEKEYVLYYRDGHFDPVSQHPSYQNRVDLQDKDMKNGNFSLILNNVTMEDNGTYECRVFEIGNKDPINIINLEVHLSGKLDEITGDGGNKTGGDKNGITRGHHGLVGCVILLLLLAVFASVGFLILRNHRSQNPNLPVPPDETAVEQML